ncbi:hypothetical protein DPMN_014681, partial [Dreissena polymorpha]
MATNDATQESTVGRRKSSAAWATMKKVKRQLRLTNEGATPVQWKLVFLVFMSLFSSSFNVTFLFPFLPEMILMFGYKEEEKGYYAGFVASALFVGRFFGSYFWGWLSDRVGRKPVMLLTILLNGLSSLAFGFTTSITFAIITRLFSGLVNGTVGTSKTILYEISDNTNQAVGMSIISVAWGMGMMVGPAVGGYLANPCKRYPEMFPSEGFFFKFPYFLPGFIAFCLCFLPFVLDIFFLPETLNMKKTEVEVIVIEEPGKASIEDAIVDDRENFQGPGHMVGPSPGLTVSVEDLHLESEGATFLAGHKKELQVSRHGITAINIDTNHTDRSYDSVKNGKEGLSNVNESDVSVKEKLPESVDVKDEEVTLLNGDKTEKSPEKKKPKNVPRCCWQFLNWPTVRMMREHDVVLAVGLYSLFSISVIGVEEIFTVWAATETFYDGLGFEPSQIGAVMGASALPLLFLQLVVFPNLCRRLGIKNTLLVCTVISLVMTQATPLLHLLTNV